MKKLLLFIACIPAFAQIPANWNQKFWQFNLTPSNAYVYNSGCANVSGTPCSGAVTNNMSLTHAVAGDVWANAWAADGNIYACVDDNFGANYSGTTPNGSTGGHNFSIMKVAGNPFDGTLAITDANTMSDYGAITQTNTNGWTDNDDWKCPGGGMKSITYSGTHYMLEWVERQNNNSPFQQSNASLISTTDNWAHVSNAFGVTNSATGAAPVSPNSLINTAGFTAPSFVDFSLQDGGCPAGVLEDCGNYLYGTAIGHWTGTDTKIYSWRFPIGDVASLSSLSSDLQWFNSAKTGCNTASTGFPSCWDTIGNATAIYTAPSAILGMVPMTYIASSHKYIMMEFYYSAGGTSSTNWPVLECNSVIGPCSLNMQYFAWSGGTPSGCYNAQIDSKHSDFQSRALVISYACNYGMALNSPLSTQYTLYYNTAYLPPPRKPIAVSSLNNDRSIPANGLKFLYDMIHDYGGLTLTDYSGGGNNYTLGSNPIWSTTSRGLGFNGVSAAEIVTPLNISWTALTYGGLVLVTGASPNGYERILDQGGSTNGFWFGRNATGANSFECGVKQSTAPYGATFTLTDGASHLALCGWNGTAQSLYISGVSAALGGASPGGAPVAAANLYLGGDSGSPNDILKGTEYILPIWNRALSATEQSRVYKAIYDAAISAGVAP